MVALTKISILNGLVIKWLEGDAHVTQYNYILQVLTFWVRAGATLLLSSQVLARERLISVEILTGDVAHTYLNTYFKLCVPFTVSSSKMAEAARIANFTLLPFDVHVYIVKLLNLNEALIYAQITPEANAAVQYVFAHRKQLDFGSVLGPDGQIMLSDTTLIQVLHAHAHAHAHAHVRVETITDFSLQPSFTAFAALREYKETHWIPMEYDNPERKTRGFLCNLRYPTHTHFGGATPELYYEIWRNYDDDYGVFIADYSNCNSILPINNAPGNWSTKALQEDEDDMSEGSRPSSAMDDVDFDQDN